MAYKKFVIMTGLIYSLFCTALFGMETNSTAQRNMDSIDDDNPSTTQTATTSEPVTGESALEYVTLQMPVADAIFENFMPNLQYFTFSKKDGFENEVEKLVLGFTYPAYKSDTSKITHEYLELGSNSEAVTWFLQIWYSSIHDAYKNLRATSKTMRDRVDHIINEGIQKIKKYLTANPWAAPDNTSMTYFDWFYDAYHERRPNIENIMQIEFGSRFVFDALLKIGLLGTYEDNGKVWISLAIKSLNPYVLEYIFKTFEPSKKDLVDIINNMSDWMEFFSIYADEKIRTNFNILRIFLQKFYPESTNYFIDLINDKDLSDLTKIKMYATLAMQDQIGDIKIKNWLEQMQTSEYKDNPTTLIGNFILHMKNNNIKINDNCLFTIFKYFSGQNIRQAIKIALINRIIKNEEDTWILPLMQYFFPQNNNYFLNIINKQLNVDANDWPSKESFVVRQVLSRLFNQTINTLLYIKLASGDLNAISFKNHKLQSLLKDARFYLLDQNNINSMLYLITILRLQTEDETKWTKFYTKMNEFKHTYITIEDILNKFDIFSPILRDDREFTKIHILTWLNKLATQASTNTADRWATHGVLKEFGINLDILKTQYASPNENNNTKYVWYLSDNTKSWPLQFKHLYLSKLDLAEQIFTLDNIKDIRYKLLNLFGPRILWNTCRTKTARWNLFWTWLKQSSYSALEKCKIAAAFAQKLAVSAGTKIKNQLTRQTSSTPETPAQ
ncbi:MAG: hypothetical protein US22_C0060G0006 [candidate division TM6 bacterium GW2011_GWF2_36_6]|nr:MAG: hypothetical protein US22_C0060G0006 [candidate division TM6 bacterium GW2011_GWF2_36_6]